MQKGSQRDPSKRAGLSVRYCFNGTDEDCRPGSQDPEDPESIAQSPDLTPSQPEPPPALQHLPYPNYWFRSSPSWGTNRQSRLASARLRRRSRSPPGDTDSDQGVWRDEEDEDPGFFVTGKVNQPGMEDTLSWDSSCNSSSSEEDIRDIYIDGVVAGTNNNYLWGSNKTPIPPRACNLSSNKGGEEFTTRNSNFGNHSNKKIENTYRLEPKHGQGFAWFKARKPMVSIVDQLLGEVTYNAKSGPAVTRKLCEIIMKVIKKTFDWPRYKFVCNVTLVQLKRQGIMIADRALWNTSVDNVASYVHKNKSLVCVVTFHALYFE
ncbi:Tctex1 domain-containing protein 4 [Elysia marginata]|uniref:Tctex1 domain-containing protein 4 n=1 Tax=Elysia marginata TaxID=1093978 RepID=A0AAV4F8T6_9GAST|nr:Tctex1 domain-containing protein 4 [Elysia marginata]